MGQLGTLVQQLSGPSFGYSEGLLKDIKPERFARFTTPGGTTVSTNHPAWQIGHLAIYPAKVSQACGLKLEGVSNSEQDLALFEAGKDCQDDAKGSIYPTKDELTGKFFDGYRKLVAACAEASDDFLAAPHEGNERMREFMPSRVALLSFMVSGHIMMHMGQISTWRRCEGMGPAM